MQSSQLSKLEVSRKVCQPAPAPVSQSARVRFRSRSNHSQSLMAGNFAALWPTDPTFSALKDLNPFKIVYKVQEASSILRMGFARLDWPHFNRAYVVSRGFGCPHLYVTIFWEIALVTNEESHNPDIPDSSDMLIVKKTKAFSRASLVS